MTKNIIFFNKESEKLFNQEKFEEIIALLTDKVLETQNNSELYAWRGNAWYNKMEYSKAIIDYNKAMKNNPNNSELYIWRGNAWCNKMEYGKAIEDYTKAIDLNPDSGDAYYNRGLAWQSRKETEKAIIDFEKAIEIYNRLIKNSPNDAKLYIGRGNAWYYQEKYDRAIDDYTKATDLNPDFEFAYYNRGLASFANKEYDKAIEDYTKVIGFRPDFDVYYVDRGNALKAEGKYKEAIADYTEAIKINPDSENVYYIRGLVKKERNIDLEGSKQDFEKYVNLTTDENDIWTKYAKYYIEDLNARINDEELSDIADLVAEIKEVLLINEDYITHYTSLSVLKSLIFDGNKFRISEGNFMNDPSEGKEFFNFLKYKPYTSCSDDSILERFSPKPFIGSFVTKDKNNDLNMWRFYGKEEGIEAKGCAITLHSQDFIDEIKNFLSNEEKEAREADESDINFYWVVYVDQNGTTKFYIPNSEKNVKLERLMKKLKKKVRSYNKNSRNDKAFLEKYLNDIAFLFKSEAYRNENEVRLVIKGIEFEKKYNMNVFPPRVYIELESIKKIVKQITLGPKVDKVNEWASAFHYNYEINIPEIIISHLPYK